MYEIWKNPELSSSSRVAGSPNVDDTPANDQSGYSERYQDNLRQQNEDGTREAQECDTSFIATPDEPLRQIDEKPPATAPIPNRPRPPANVPDYARINQLAQLMATQQQGLIGAWTRSLRPSPSSLRKT